MEEKKLFFLPNPAPAVIKNEGTLLLTYCKSYLWQITPNEFGVIPDKKKMKRTLLGSMREGTRDAGAPPTQGATRVTPTLHVEEGALSFTLLVNPIRGNLGQNTQGALRVMRPSWMMACARRRRRIQVGTTHPPSL